MTEKAENDRMQQYGPTLHSLPQRRGALLGFEWQGEQFAANPWRPFRPRGLLIWGAPPLAVVDFAIINNGEQVKCSRAGVPAKFFATGESFEQIAAQLDAGKEPPVWVNWETLLVHDACRVCVRAGRTEFLANGDELAKGQPLGPAHGLELVFWGFALEP